VALPLVSPGKRIGLLSHVPYLQGLRGGSPLKSPAGLPAAPKRSFGAAKQCDVKKVVGRSFT
jgi:hypothetical protein